MRTPDATVAIDESEDIDDLIGRVGQKELYFKVFLESGDVLVFSYPKNYTDYRKAQREANAVAAGWLAKAPHPSWQEYISGQDDEALKYVYLLAGRCVQVHLFKGFKGEGDEKEAIYKSRGPFEQRDFLKMAAKAPGAFAGVREQFDSKIAVVVIALDADSIDMAKKA